MLGRQTRIRHSDAMKVESEVDWAYQLKSIKKAAFTLAEVLITLGIIGIVAVLIIPPLAKQIQMVQHKSAFMKEYSTAQSAFKEAALANDGSLVGFSIVDGSTHLRSTELKDFIKPYLSYIKECNSGQIVRCSPVEKYMTYYNKEYPSDWSSLSTPQTYQNAALILNDGSIWRFHSYNYPFKDCTYNWVTTNNSCGLISIDTNGAGKPNRAGYDIFEFHIVSDGSVIPMGTTKDSFKNTYSKAIGYDVAVSYMLGISQ